MFDNMLDLLDELDNINWMTSKAEAEGGPYVQNPLVKGPMWMSSNCVPSTS